MIRTRVGYAGGKAPHPTYRNLGDHTETIQIDYDPRIISYAELLEIFWQEHQPTARPWSRQYASLILYNGEEQKDAAQKSKAKLAESKNQTVYTIIAPLEIFYPAEDYHQKYYLRSEPLLARELLAHFPDPVDFRNSAAVSRVNGYLAGSGEDKVFARELPLLGLSQRARDYLDRQFTARNRILCK